MSALKPAWRLAAVAVLCTPLLAAAGVSVQFDPSSPSSTPFPSDRFAVRDWSQRTFKRVNLPQPDCAVKPVECQDVAVLNELDGFSTQPRISIPFTGPIDLASVTPKTVYLLNLGDTFTLHGFGQRVGLNQIEWDSASNTLVAQSDQLLAEHSRYLLIVTNGVRDVSGARIEGGRFAQGERGRGNDEYERDMRSSLRGAGGRDLPVAATLFTTQSITPDLIKITRQLKQARPGPMNFMIGTSAGNAVRAVFDPAQLQGIRINRQTGTAPVFASAFLPMPALNVVPGAVGKIAYATYRSPDYETAGRYIPTVATLWGQPQPQGSNDLVAQFFLPSGSKPAGGWPVVIFGHGFTDSMYGVPWTVASVMASKGIATVSINVVGHGFGALGTLDVLPLAGAPVSVPAGGRGIDQDGNGTIDSTEGVNAVAPRAIVSSRDGLRQTVIDLMQLVRQLQTGVDVDGDGSTDLDGSRIYYAGQSFGGIYGTIFMGVEPDVKAGVPNVPGGSITEIARLSPSFRILTAISLAQRNLLNLPPVPNVPPPLNLAFNENIPLRDLPPLVSNVPGASAIQVALDRFQWVSQSGNPVSYASLIRKDPLPGQVAKPVLIQFAKSDQTVPNPTTSAIVRAGELADRTVLYRHDLAYAAFPTLPKNPHTFLSNIAQPEAAPFAVGAQTQMAVFFASGGTTVIDPDGAGPFFEVPIAGPLPETLSFIP